MHIRVFGWRLGILRGKSPILRGYHRFWMGLTSPRDINPILSRRILEFGGAIIDFEGEIIDFEGKSPIMGGEIINLGLWEGKSSILD